MDPLSIDEYEKICREDRLRKSIYIIYYFFIIYIIILECTITTTENCIGIPCLCKPVKYILSCNCFKIEKVSLSKAIEELINTVYFTTRKVLYLFIY